MTIHPAIAAGKVAAITGGANGIGLATAQRLTGLGMRIAIADMNEAQMALAAGLLGDKALIIPTDVSDRAAVESFAAQVTEQLGPVSLLMNNAGVGGGGDILSSPEDSSRILGVNLMGVLHGVQSFVPAMVANDQPGLVINTGSKQGITQPPGNTAYNVSKSGVKSLTEGLAHTLRENTGARVSAHLLIPGFTYTGMMKQFMPEKPPAAWTPDQVVDVMMAGLAKRDFYLWCQDNETSWETDRKRILWNAGDISENRPALSRWHPDYKSAFAAYCAGD